MKIFLSNRKQLCESSLMLLIKGWQRLVEWAFALWCIHLGLIGSKSVFRASCCPQTKKETYFSSCNCHSPSPAGSRTSIKADASQGEKEEEIVSRRAMLKNWGDELLIQNPSAVQVCSREGGICNCHWNQIMMRDSAVWLEKEGLNWPYSTEGSGTNVIAAVDSYSISWPRLSCTLGMMGKITQFALWP